MSAMNDDPKRDAEGQALRPLIQQVDAGLEQTFERMLADGTVNVEELAAAWHYALRCKIRQLVDFRRAQHEAAGDLDRLDAILAAPSEDGLPPAELMIGMFMHCRQCVEALSIRAQATGQPVSPQQYSQLDVGWTPYGLQVWCRRHNVNVLHVDFEGLAHPARR